MVRQLLVVLAWCVSERTTEFSSQQIGDALYSWHDRIQLAANRRCALQLSRSADVGWCDRRNRLLVSFGLWCGVHCGDKGHLDLVTNEQLWSDTLPATVQSDGDDDVRTYSCEVGGAKAQRCASGAFSYVAQCFAGSRALDPIVRMRNLILHTRSSDSPGGMLVAFLALLVTAADLPAGSAKGGPDGLARSRA
jgi:hypothetical protein